MILERGVDHRSMHMEALDFAYERAKLRGRVQKRPLGGFRKSSLEAPAIFAMEVLDGTGNLDRFAWVSLATAASALNEPLSAELERLPERIRRLRRSTKPMDADNGGGLTRRVGHGNDIG